MSALFALFAMENRLPRLARRNPLKAYKKIEKLLHNVPPHSAQLETVLSTALSLIPAVILVDKNGNGLKIANRILSLIAPYMGCALADFSNTYGTTSKETAIMISPYMNGGEPYGFAVRVADQVPQFCLSCSKGPQTERELREQEEISLKGPLLSIPESFISSAKTILSEPCLVPLLNNVRAALIGKSMYESPTSMRAFVL